jgi:hypothetical protein
MTKMVKIFLFCDWVVIGNLFKIVNDYQLGLLLVFNATFNKISVIIVVVSFIGDGNQSTWIIISLLYTWIKPPTCHKSLTNYIT